MCGRYGLKHPPWEVTEFFRTTNPFPNQPPSWNIAPTQSSLVVRRHPQTGARHLDALHWGLVPHWSKDASGAARMINARAEGVAQKPAYRDAFQQRRCLVPMSAFYEWRQEGAIKQPYAVAPRSGAPMAVAGLWEGWRQEDGSWLRSFTVITTEAPPRQQLIHARTPVILGEATWEGWLDGSAGTEVLHAAAAEDLAIWPVDRRVGRVAENDAGLMARDPGASPPAGLDDHPPWED